MGTRQYGRKVSIIVGNDAGAAEDFSALRVEFSVRRGDFQSPNSADVRIYNVTDATATKIKKEFTRVVIQAGYEGTFGLIFDGTIKQARAGRLNATDTYIDVTAADGDEAYNFAPLALSLAAGAKPADAVQAFLAHMPGSVVRGYVPELSQNGAVRGRVYYGMVRDELRDFAAQNDCTWSIQDGKLTLIPLTSYVPGNVIVLSPQTGLIGTPEQTQNGIEARVLLNPALKIGQRVKLDSVINQLRYGLDVQSQANNGALSRSVKTNADGLYYVMTANHRGDTRGNDFYTDLVCLAVDATVPASAAPQAAIAPEAASIKRN